MVHPRDEPLGTTQIPRKYRFPNIKCHVLIIAVTRVKKIIAVDEDITQCSNNAAFVITLATVGPPASFNALTDVI